VGVGDLKGRRDVPILGDDLESTMPGVFVAGELTGLALIRNAIEQGRRVAETVAARTRSRPRALGEAAHDLVIVGAGPAGLSAALAAADLGLCLHRSASGLDLPMKIADMFGAGLPVCALDDGGCLREMVRPDVDARLFADAEGLATALADLLGGADGATPALVRLRAGALAAAAGPRWDDAWRVHAAPLLLAERA
jgi:hypothetical protein